MHHVICLRTLEASLGRVLRGDRALQGNAFSFLSDETDEDVSGDSEYTTPQQEVMSGDLLYYIVDRTGRKDDKNLAQTHRHGSEVVRQKYVLMKALIAVCDTFQGPIRIFASPVKTNTRTYFIYTGKGNYGYVNLYPKGAMVTMLTQEQEEDDRDELDIFECVSVSSRIVDPVELIACINKPLEFWSSQSPYVEWDNGDRPEMRLVLRNEQNRTRNDSIVTTVGPFEDYFSRSGRNLRISVLMDRQGDWQFEFRDTARRFQVDGIIRKDVSEGVVTLWCRTVFDGGLDNGCLDPSIQAFNNSKWELLSMKHGIRSSVDLDRYILENDWTNPADALFVYPTYRSLIDWMTGQIERRGVT